MGWFFLFGVVAAGSIAIAVVRARAGERRQRTLFQLCADAGLACAVLDPFPDTALLPFRVFGWGSAHGIENVVWDGSEDRGIRVFDLWVQPSPDEARRTMTCGVVPLPFAVPQIAILARGQADPSEEPVIGDAVHLELDAFEQRFEVRAVDPRAAVALLDQRMMAALLRSPMRVAIHVRENAMLLVAPLLEPGEMLVLLTCAKALADQVPPVVVSLYPPRPSRGPYEQRWLQGVWSPDPTSVDAPEPG
ncbi:MAG TPA: hypothetical protein VHW68_07605 [Actinomycetota bacterium]|jgi:hypothetical protein|nr:hypothetical protein [Actinomycetota bacterium]